MILSIDVVDWVDFVPRASEWSTSEIEFMSKIDSLIPGFSLPRTDRGIDVHVDTGPLIPMFRPALATSSP